MDRVLMVGWALLLGAAGCGSRDVPSAPTVASSMPASADGGSTPTQEKVAPSPATARDLQNVARAADQAGNLEACMKNDEAALALHELPLERLHLASCQSRAGKLVAAYGNILGARAFAREMNDPALVQVANARATELEGRIGVIRVRLDAATAATLDGEPIMDRVRNIVDPGAHELMVTFSRGTQRKTITVAEGDVVELAADAKTQTIATPPPEPPRPKGPRGNDLFDLR